MLAGGAMRWQLSQKQLLDNPDVTEGRERRRYE